VLTTTSAKAMGLNVLPTGSQPLGDAFVVTFDGEPLDQVGRVLQAVQLAPWCPLVVVSACLMSDATLGALGTLFGPVAVATLESGCLSPTIDAITIAIARRGPPRLSDVAGYVRRRTDARAAHAAAEALLGPPRWTVGLRRHLAGLRLPSPQHWRNLYTLITYLAASAYPRRRTLEQVALEHNRAPRTLSSWCARYLHCSWPEAQRRLGWEWAVEVFLREHGCCEIPPPPPDLGVGPRPRRAGSLSTPELRLPHSRRERG